MVQSMSLKQTRLFKRKSTYYIRFAVPKHLISLVKKTEIRYSLYTKCYKEASFRARTISLKLDLVFRKLDAKIMKLERVVQFDKNGIPTTALDIEFTDDDFEKCIIYDLEKIKGFIEENYHEIQSGTIKWEDVQYGSDEHIKLYEKMTNCEPLETSEESCRSFFTYIGQEVFQSYLKRVYNNSDSEIIKSLLEKQISTDTATLIKNNNLNINSQHIERLLAGLEILEDYGKKYFAAIKEDQIYEPKNPKLRRWLNYLEAKEQARYQEADVKTNWKQVLPEFIEHKRCDKIVNETTLDANTKKLEVIFSVIKKEYLQDITYKDCLDLSVKLSSLPKRYSVKSKKSTQEPISIRTKISYLQVFREFMQWCYRSRFISNDLSSDITIPNKKAIEKSDIIDRVAFDKKDLLKIFNHNNLYKRMHKKGAWQYFIMLIGFTTGCRLNEACQLNISDIQKENGIWYYNFTNEGDNQRVKNVPSKRKTPIHSLVIDMGLLDYIKYLKKNKETRLFPPLKYRKNHGYSGNASLWFGRYLTRLGITEKEKVFHSFRYFMKEEMRDIGVSTEFHNAICGWAQQGTGSIVYGKHFSLPVLKRELEKFRFPFLEKTLKELKDNRPRFMKWEELNK